MSGQSATVAETSSRHVIPEQPAEAEPHRAEPQCWCQPRLVHEDPVTGGRVYVHKRES